MWLKILFALYKCLDKIKDDFATFMFLNKKRSSIFSSGFSKKPLSLVFKEVTLHKDDKCFFSYDTMYLKKVCLNYS